jgi:hypothetical protein
MPNYQDSVIYKIYSHCCDDEYIGSTTQNLRVRLGQHKRDFKRWKNDKKSKYYTSFKLLEQDHFDIIEVAKAPCNSKQELARIEGEYIKNTNCVNKNIAGRTDKEWRQDNREKLKKKAREYRQNNSQKIREKDRKYQQINKDKIKQQKKKYYQDNKQYLKDKFKQYQQINKDKIKQQKKKYHQDNEDKIKQYRQINKDKIKQYNKQYYQYNKQKSKQKHNCPCGGKYTTSGKSHHFKTAKHFQHILQQFPFE